MNTITFPVYITVKPMEYEWDSDKPYVAGGLEFVARNWIYSKEQLVHTAQVTFEIPQDVDPTRMKIEALEAERTELLADTQIRVNHINDQISKLQALTFDGVEA